MGAAQAVAPAAETHGSSVGAMVAIFRRDIVVTGREFWMFLAQVLLRPLATLFLFGRILRGIGMASRDYAQILMPGMVVLTVVITALQSTAMPLVIEFGWTKEIENAYATTESICHRVRRWRNAAQAKRWATMALLKAERGFGRAASPEAMAELAKSLERHLRERARELPLAI